MKYLLFEDITLRTSLPSDEVVDRIRQNLEPERMFRTTGFFCFGSYLPYQGVIDNQSFNISRIIGYNNSFLPRIKGQIEKDVNGTIIRVKMKPHLLALVFMIIWHIGVPLAFIAAILFTSIDIGIFALFPVAMFAFSYGLTICVFKYESSKSKQFLIELLEAEIE